MPVASRFFRPDPSATLSYNLRDRSKSICGTKQSEGESGKPLEPVENFRGENSRDFRLNSRSKCKIGIKHVFSYTYPEPF